MHKIWDLCSLETETYLDNGVKLFCFCSAELQKLIDEKNNELAKKTEELKARSVQPQRREWNMINNRLKESQSLNYMYNQDGRLI